MTVEQILAITVPPCAVAALWLWLRFLRNCSSAAKPDNLDRTLKHLRDGKETTYTYARIPMTVAEAVAEERERCAKIAEEFRSLRFYGDQDRCMAKLAEKIRKGDECRRP